MKQFYLRYTQDSKKSESPFTVRIGVSLNPIHDRASVPDNYPDSKYDFGDRVYFKCDSPESVLAALERGIFDKGICSPLKFSFDYITSKWQEKIQNKEVHMVFRPMSNFCRHGETAKSAKQRAIKYNAKLHSKIFPIYRQFIREHAPYAEKGE